jgi:hypothetical protein
LNLSANHYESQYTRNSILVTNRPSEKRTSVNTSSSIPENVVAKNMVSNLNLMKKFSKSLKKFYYSKRVI